MAISPMDLNIMQRSMDVAQIKHNSDMRPTVEQANMVIQAEKDIHVRMEKVVKSNESDKTSTEHDAREKGKNFYFRREEERKKKKEEQEEDGRVLLKNQASFDMKI